MDAIKLHRELEELYNEVDIKDETEYRSGYLDAIKYVLEMVEEEMD